MTGIPAGSDLVYEDYAPDLLAPLVRKLLTAGTAGAACSMLLAHRHRRQALDNMMMSAFSQAGLQLRPLQTTGSEEEGNEAETVTIYRVMLA